MAGTSVYGPRYASPSIPLQCGRGLDGSEPRQGGEVQRKPPLCKVQPRTRSSLSLSLTKNLALRDEGTDREARALEVERVELNRLACPHLAISHHESTRETRSAHVARRRPQVSPARRALLVQTCCLQGYRREGSEDPGCRHHYCRA